MQMCTSFLRGRYTWSLNIPGACLLTDGWRARAALTSTSIYRVYISTGKITIRMHVDADFPGAMIGFIKA